MPTTTKTSASLASKALGLLWGTPPILGALALCLALGLASFVGGYPPSAKAATPDWNGHTEVMVSQSQATSGTALIVTAIPASGSIPAARVNVKSIVMTGGTAGQYVFFSGSTVTGAHQIGQFYLAANTPVAYTVENFRQGMKTVNGEGLYCVGAGTLTYTLVFFEDTSGG